MGKLSRKPLATLPEQVAQIIMLFCHCALPVLCCSLLFAVRGSFLVTALLQQQTSDVFHKINILAESYPAEYEPMYIGSTWMGMQIVIQNIMQVIHCTAACTIAAVAASPETMLYAAHKVVPTPAHLPQREVATPSSRHTCVFICLPRTHLVPCFYFAELQNSKVLFLG